MSSPEQQQQYSTQSDTIRTVSKWETNESRDMESHYLGQINNTIVQNTNIPQKEVPRMLALAGIARFHSLCGRRKITSRVLEEYSATEYVNAAEVFGAVQGWRMDKELSQHQVVEQHVTQEQASKGGRLSRILHGR